MAALLLAAGDALHQLGDLALSQDFLSSPIGAALLGNCDAFTLNAPVVMAQYNALLLQRKYPRLPVARSSARDSLSAHRRMRAFSKL